MTLTPWSAIFQKITYRYDLIELFPGEFSDSDPLVSIGS
jgi:hypothetical protein